MELKLLQEEDGREHD